MPYQLMQTLAQAQQVQAKPQVLTLESVLLSSSFSYTFLLSSIFFCRIISLKN
jgi:hypothetical protein